MAQWQNTIYTEHAPDSPNERFGLSSTSQTRYFDIMDGSFKGRNQAAYDILGYGVVVASGNAGVPYYLSRVNPMPAPALSAASYKLRADAVKGTTVPDQTDKLWAGAISRTEPLGSPAGVDPLAQPFGTAAARYNRARLTVEFSTLPFQILPDGAVTVATPDGTAVLPDEGQMLQSAGWAATRYISRQIESYSRVIEIPYGVENVIYSKRALQYKASFPKREGGADVTYTWVRVPLTTGAVSGVNFAAINALLGTINDQSFDGFAALSLFFASYSTREYQGSFGERLVDVRYNMVYLPHPSNGLRFNGGGGPAAGTAMGWNSVYSIDPDTSIMDYYPVSSNSNPSVLPCPLANSIKDAAGNTYSFADLFRPTRAL